MKASKFLSSAILASVMLAGVADAGSIGRAGGGGGGHSVSSGSSHSSSFSAPSRPSPAPSVAPAPAKSGGIGGTQGAMGVRKSDVTGPVANNVNAGKPGNFSPTPNTVPHSSPAPSYGYTPPPAPVVVQSGGSGFGSSFMGALGGTIVGNALFGNHGNGGTTVVNNGGYSQGPAPVAQGGTYTDSSGQVVQSAPVVVQQKESMGMGTIILNVILFAILLLIIGGIVFLFYNLFKKTKEYVNKERGVSTQPFNPTQRFWEIQKAFAAADVASLNNLLGPDLVDEATANLQPSTLTLHNVSHEVRLNNTTEFSIWYKFTDNDEEANQVWHYEKFGKDWKLNGIENV